MIRAVLTKLGALTSSPWAFGIVAIYGIAWAMLEGINWHGAATLATWLMTLLIQRSEHRDTQAIHAKLDSLIKATGADRNLIDIDEAEPEEIEKHREAH